MEIWLSALYLGMEVAKMIALHIVLCPPITTITSFHNWKQTSQFMPSIPMGLQREQDGTMKRKLG